MKNTSINTLRAAPSFGCEAGSLVNQDFLTKSVQAELLALLPATVNQAQAAEFLKGCATSAQIVSEDSARHGSTAGDVRTALVGLEGAAHRMQNALQPLAGDGSAAFYALESSFDVLRLVPPDGVELPDGTPELGDLLARLWADLEALRIGADFANQKKSPIRPATKGGEQARVLVRLAAQSFARVAGKLPPGHKDAWFADFMSVLAAAVNLECGHRIVSGVVGDLKKAVPT